MVAGAEGGCGAIEGKVAEVVEADGQVAVLTAKRKSSICLGGWGELMDGRLNGMAVQE